MQPHRHSQRETEFAAFTELLQNTFRDARERSIGERLMKGALIGTKRSLARGRR